MITHRLDHTKALHQGRMITRADVAMHIGLDGCSQVYDRAGELVARHQVVHEQE